MKSRKKIVGYLLCGFFMFFLFSIFCSNLFAAYTQTWKIENDTTTERSTVTLVGDMYINRIDTATANADIIFESSGTYPMQLYRGDLQIVTTGYGITFPDGSLQISAGVGGIVDTLSSTGTVVINSDSDNSGAESIIFRTAGATERMRLISSGNLGIGTTNPVTKLEVNNGDIKISTGNFLLTPGDTWGISSVFLQANVDTSFTGTGDYFGFYFPAGKGFALKQASGFNHVIKPDGRVGIGTTAPESALVVAGANSGESIIYLGNNTYSTATGRKAALRLGDTGILDIFSSADVPSYEKDMIFRTHGSADGDRLTIKAGGNVGIGTTAPAAKLEVNGDSKFVGNFLSSGTYGSGSDVPATGSGTRMFFYPKKAAFRAGDAYLTGWDDANIGAYSAAMGYATTATGAYSFAAGFSADATGSGSVAAGHNSAASGTDSIAIGYITAASSYSAVAFGYQTTASADYATAIGYNTIASNTAAVAMGYSTTASGYASFAMGDGPTASGGDSTAMGYNTTASASYATAMGYNTTASGAASFALGANTDATGAYAFGINLDGTVDPVDIGNSIFRITGAAEIGGNQAWTNYSDMRLKTDIEILSAEDNLSKILSLNGVRFKWKEKQDERIHLGFLAQDVQLIIPESVLYDSLNDIYSMEYNAIIPVLVEAIKELKAEKDTEINDLKNQIEILKKK